MMKTFFTITSKISPLLLFRRRTSYSRLGNYSCLACRDVDIHSDAIHRSLNINKSSGLDMNAKPVAQSNVKFYDFVNEKSPHSSPNNSSLTLLKTEIRYYPAVSFLGS
eukprot:scaffold4843_cov48-Attheya_sp.AAC.3